MTGIAVMQGYRSNFKCQFFLRLLVVTHIIFFVYFSISKFLFRKCFLYLCLPLSKYITANHAALMKTLQVVKLFDGSA